MPGFQEVNQELEWISREIETKTGEFETAREDYLKKKAEYEYLLAGETIKAKTLNDEATQTDVKAEATRNAHVARLSMIASECTYKRLLNEIRAHRDRLEALREVSFNLRKEASI